jgi:excisionase family DNA binding protein
MAYITIPQLAKMLGVSRITIYRKVKNGQIPAKKIGHTYVITNDEIQRILSRELTSKDKSKIEKLVKRVVKEYGETLRLLGKE